MLGETVSKCTFCESHQKHPCLNSWYLNTKTTVVTAEILTLHSLAEGLFIPHRVLTKPMYMEKNVIFSKRTSLPTCVVIFTSISPIKLFLVKDYCMMAKTRRFYCFKMLTF